MPNITGSCLCGAVRYSSSAQPSLAAFCHCRSCQKTGGGGYSVNVAVPSASLEIEVPPNRMRNGYHRATGRASILRAMWIYAVYRRRRVSRTNVCQRRFAR